MATSPPCGLEDNPKHVTTGSSTDDHYRLGDWRVHFQTGKVSQKRDWKFIFIFSSENVVHSERDATSCRCQFTVKAGHVWCYDTDSKYGLMGRNQIFDALSYSHKWQIHHSAEMSCLQIYWISTKFVVLGDLTFSWQ